VVVFFLAVACNQRKRQPVSARSGRPKERQQRQQALHLLASSTRGIKAFRYLLHRPHRSIGLHRRGSRKNGGAGPLNFSSPPVPCPFPFPSPLSPWTFTFIPVPPPLFFSFSFPSLPFPFSWSLPSPPCLPFFPLPSLPLEVGPFESS